LTVAVTGERVVTSEGGFNPTWQRHVAAYSLCEGFLSHGLVIDVGCGVGHSYRLLAPRETVGVDVDAAVLDGQQRQTVAADMRRLPFADAEFDAAIAVHSIEHVPDPARALEEIARVLKSEGTAALVTPNRLTFGPPDEIVDPYHYVEFDPEELLALCRRSFESVELAGIFGSERYLAIAARERVKLDALLRHDPLRLRRLVPRRLRQHLYDRRLARERSDPDPEAQAISPHDFSLGHDRLDTALDLVAVCRGPSPHVLTSPITERP
jgi:SAM-dependent methyltransferase